MSSRLLEILFAFKPAQSHLSLADIVRITGMPHATVRRLVVELAQSGALDHRADGRYAIGLRLWQLGTLAPLAEPLRAMAQAFMEDLYAALHQHVQLAVLEGRQAVIVERLSEPRALHLVSQVGGRLPLHCSGVGKVLLAHGGNELTEAVLAGTLEQHTPQTIVDSTVLRKELAECRSTGTAHVRGELTTGADSIATRIMDGEGRVVAALSVVIRSGSVSHQAVLPSVVTSGLGISRMLGWRHGIRIHGR